MNPFERQRVLQILENSDTRLTAGAFIKRIAHEFSIKRFRAGKMLTALINRGDLTYIDLYGSTYVDTGFSKPVQVTDHFFLKPPNVSSKDQPGRFYINLLPGISFGSGRHPTTRLSLRAIDHLFLTRDCPTDASCSWYGDIGTGSGVLALAACLAGKGSCRAWDLDPNAVSEARQNIETNGMASRIQVTCGPMPVWEQGFFLICANLRFPTLKGLAGLIRTNLDPGGYLILSGIREWEKEDLVSHYREYGFFPIRHWDEKKWSAVLFGHEL